MSDNKNNTGCGLLIIDFLAIAAFVTLMMHNGAGLHIVFSILIGIAATIAFILLARLPYVGRLFQAGLGLIWGLIVYFALDNLFHYEKDVGLMSGLRANDQISWWAIVIIVDIICVLLHIGVFSLNFPTFNFGKGSRIANGYERKDREVHIIVDDDDDDNGET